VDDGGNSACSTWFDSSSSMFTSRVLLPPSAQLHHSIGCGTTDDHAVDCLRDSLKDRIALVYGRKRRLGRSAADRNVERGRRFSLGRRTCTHFARNRVGSVVGGRRLSVFRPRRRRSFGVDNWTWRVRARLAGGGRQ